MFYYDKANERVKTNNSRHAKSALAFERLEHKKMWLSGNIKNVISLYLFNQIKTQGAFPPDTV